MFFLLYSIDSPNFIVWLSLLWEILGNICIAIACKCDVMNFEVALMFLIKPFFLHDQKVVTKTQISWERKKLLRWNKKHSPSFLKGFQSRKYRSSHPGVFLGKGVLKIYSKFTGEHPYRSTISIKLLSNFIEIALRHGFFPLNLLHIFRTPFPRNTPGWLLLQMTQNFLEGESPTLNI